jgi:hypothetical protein
MNIEYRRGFYEEKPDTEEPDRLRHWHDHELQQCRLLKWRNEVCFGRTLPHIQPEVLVFMVSHEGARAVGCTTITFLEKGFAFQLVWEAAVIRLREFHLPDDRNMW